MRSALDPRHIARQKTVQELFAWEAQNQALSSSHPRYLLPTYRRKPDDPSISSAAGKKAPAMSKLEKFSPKTMEIISNIQMIDEFILEGAPEREIDKINKVDLAVLREAIYEMVIEHSTPVKVAIDEAVELAKEFGGDSSPALINGALAKIVHSPKRILRLLSDHLGVEPEKLKPDADLLSDLNASPLEISDLSAILSRELNLPNLTQTKFSTISEILDYVDDHKD